MERISRIVKELFPAEEILQIHNPESDFCSFYELKTPFAFVVAEFNLDKNYIDYSVMAPNHFSRYKEILTESLLMDRTLHQHNGFEMMFVLNGNCAQWIEEQKYQYHAGRCCLINHNVRHVEILEDNTELFFLLMSDEFTKMLAHNDLALNKEGRTVQNKNRLYDLFNNSGWNKEVYEKQYWDFFPIAPVTILIPKIQEIFSRLILENRELGAGSFLMIQALIAKILGMLSDPTIYSIRKVQLSESKDEIIFANIHRVLEEQCGKVDRTELEQTLHYSAHYMNQIVKKYTGKTLLEYSKIFALREAAKLLVSSKMSVADIMALLEFTNRTVFYKAFKSQYGITPKEYREKNKVS